LNWRVTVDEDGRYCLTVAAISMPNGNRRRSRQARNISLFVAECATMNRNELLDTLRTYATPLRENGATGLFVFGSRARDTNRGDSDLDLFIDYDPSARVPNIFRLMQIEERISETLGIPVTITARSALHPLMKDSIERDAIRVL
jgi:predicted nucleotidyltransferase